MLTCGGASGFSHRLAAITVAVFFPEMNVMQTQRLILAGVLAAGNLLSDATAAEKDPVDRGPTFSGTIRSSYPAGNVTMKGVVVTLGTDTNAFICYDTDLMRVSVAWTGDYLKFGNYMREIVHPQPPEVAGKPVFGLKPGPGWARDGKFADPRANQQGPLPNDWAHYRGLYLNGRDVVFSYNVRKTEVLEMPRLETIDGLQIFTRTLEIRALRGMDQAETVAICDAPGGYTKLSTNPQVLLFADPASPDNPELSIAVIGDPGALVESVNGQVVAMLSPKATEIQILIARTANGGWKKFNEIVQRKRELPDLWRMIQGGAPRWKEPVVTKGSLGTSESPYVVDILPEPVPNPWRVNTFFGGFDFFPDGRAAICTFHGDVWIVSGIDDKLEKVTWRRYATGLFQPLGLKVVDEKVFVLGRDQITRLHDLNRDGEADYYENFNNDTVVTANYHEFCLDLQTDSKGNFYFFKGSPWTPTVTTPHQGALLKVSKDGSKLEVYATGFRAPNGSAVGPNDEITVSDNQGHWMPASKLNLVKKGGFYGMTPAAHREIKLQGAKTNYVLNPSDPKARAAVRLQEFDAGAPIPTNYDEPICWLPMNMDNSSGGQVWVTSKKWGPLENHLLFMSYGHCSLFNVMQEEVDGVTQAGMVRFPIRFPTGVMRGRCNPRDGQIYLCGLRGWQTDGTKDGGFYRVRYTGKPVYMPAELHTAKDALTIAFTCALDPAAAADVANYAIEQWNYAYTGGYGSPDVSAADPKVKHRDKVEIKSAKLAKDGKTVVLEIPGLQPVDQMRIKMTLKAADGAPVNQEIYNTVHKIGS
jgi:Domain of unknown function (DUF6797)